MQHQKHYQTLTEKGDQKMKEDEISTEVLLKQAIEVADEIEKQIDSKRLDPFVNFLVLHKLFSSFLAVHQELDASMKILDDMKEELKDFWKQAERDGMVRKEKSA